MALRHLAHRGVSPRSWLAPWPRCAPSSPALTTVPAVFDFTEGSPKGPDLRCYRPPGTDAVGVELVGPGPVLVAASVNGGPAGSTMAGPPGVAGHRLPRNCRGGDASSSYQALAIRSMTFPWSSVARVLPDRYCGSGAGGRRSLGCHGSERVPPAPPAARHDHLGRHRTLAGSREVTHGARFTSMAQGRRR